MKKISIFILTMVFLLLFDSTAIGQHNSFRIMTYNIMNGYDYGKDTIREAKATKWINAQHPDVVALQELCGYTDARLRREAAKWGHSYVLLLKTTGYSVGITSNKPIRLIERKIEGLWHGMLHCEINGIDFFIVHLSPDDYNYRRNEADTIITRLTKSIQVNKQCIVLGDFNSRSPFDDDIYKSQRILLKSYIDADLRNKTDKNLVNGNFDYSVISKFLAFPMIDVCQKYVSANKRYTFSTPILIGSYRKDMKEVRQKRERMDYILTTETLSEKCTYATVANDTATDYLSDHYPVIADFELPDN